ncbi:hypothetical protein ACQV2X_07415 [Facklamia sp. P12945]|uniref:hypothetical protein n=1 Tax=unclassified Facklamia TaxID=2622293 RepID=UPI003D17286E
MEVVSTKLFTALAEDKSVQDLFRQNLEEAINLLPVCERTVFLNYEKSEVKGCNG